jgi:hypothetical protein
MIVSRNEIESLALKAARGAGLSWGLAEEASAAAGWLAEQGLPWAEELADVLERTGTTSSPRVSGQLIEPSRAGTALCPIVTGALLSDLGQPACPLEIRDVLAPLWLAPFLARAAAPDRPLAIDWAGGHLVVAGNAAAVLGTTPGPSAAASRHRVTIAWGRVDRLSLAPPALCGTAYAAPDAAPGGAWQRLLALEHRCYVPASAQSRLAGAGAGLLDND